MSAGSLERACVLVAVVATPSGGGAVQSTSEVQTPAPIAIPLQTSNTVKFADGAWLAWKHPAVCDPDGNVFLIPVPKADPRDLGVRPEERRFVKKPSDILRISADGKKKTLMKPASVAAFADADEVTTITINADANGTLNALVWVTRGDKGDVYLVSFKEDGTYKAHLEISQQEVVPQRFEFFGSGAVLLKGFRPYEGPRAVIMSSGGGGFRDAASPDGQRPGAGGLPSATGDAVGPSGATNLDRVTRGGDGRIYFVPGGGNSVYVMDESGESGPAFELSPPTRNSELVEVKGSGQRLAAVYYEDRGDTRARFWIATYDISLGERVALYGPVEDMPLCYVEDEGQDRFTVLKDAKYLVTLSSPR